MPDIADDNWSERDDQNAEVAPYGWPPGVPAQIELIGRMMMGAIKRSWRRFNPFYPTTGTADAYVVTPSSNPQFINIYEIIRVRIDRANTTTTPTLKYGGVNARTIKRITPAGKVTVAVGDLVAGKDHGFWYDGTDFILMDPATISGTLVTGALLAANNLSDVLSASTSLSNLGGAPLNSPTFTGTVTIPSGAVIADYAPLNSPTFTGTVTIPSGASIAGYAPLASPALTGNPTAPTQSAGNNSTRLATTAYVDGAVGTAVVQPFIDVASATTTDIGAVASQNVRVTGTTTITSFGTVAAGTVRKLRFAASLTLTHNATSLILPGAQNIVTSANDEIEAVSLGSGNWYVGLYQNAGSLRRVLVTYNGTLSAGSMIQRSEGVASMTDNGTGDQTINFTTPFPDTNYTITAVGTYFVSTFSKSTGSCRLQTFSSGGALTDSPIVDVTIWR